ncbi:actin cytoskeleton and mitosis protein [Rhizina undulata]
MGRYKTNSHTRDPYNNGYGGQNRNNNSRNDRTQRSYYRDFPSEPSHYSNHHHLQDPAHQNGSHNDADINYRMETNPVRSRGGVFGGERGGSWGRGGRGRGSGGLGISGRGGVGFGASGRRGGGFGVGENNRGGAIGVGGRGGGGFGAGENNRGNGLGAGGHSGGGFGVLENTRGGRREGARGRGGGEISRGGNRAGSKFGTHKDQQQQHGDESVGSKKAPEVIPAQSNGVPMYCGNSTLHYLQTVNPHAKKQHFHSNSSVSTYYEQLKAEREEERRRLIEIGAIDDPDKPKTLEEAIDFNGTCEDMCPFHEAIQRTVQAMLDRLERNPTTQILDLSRTVKSYHRPAAGMEAPLPSDVRTPQALVKTLDYLMNELVGGEEPLIKVHPFVRDRTRSIRQDFTLQNYWGGELVACTEIIARFHIVALHKLCEDTKVFSIRQELEQLSNCLTTLIHCYNDSRERVQYPNEPEFRAYHLIFHLYQTENLSMMSSWPQYVQSSKEVRQAVRFVELVQQNNASEAIRTGNAEACTNFAHTVFRLVQHKSTPYLMACLLETHFEEIRRAALKALRMAYMKGSKRLLIDEVSTQLGYETPDDLERDLKHYGIDTGDIEIDGQMKRYIVIEKGRPWRDGEPGIVLPSRPHFLVESKIAGRFTILDAIYGHKTEITNNQSNSSKYRYTTPVPSVESYIPRALRAASPAREASRKNGPLPLAGTKTVFPSVSTSHARLASSTVTTTKENVKRNPAFDFQQEKSMPDHGVAAISSNTTSAKISSAFSNIPSASVPFSNVDSSSTNGFASQQYTALSPFAANTVKTVQRSKAGLPIANPFKPVVPFTVNTTNHANDVKPSAFGPSSANARPPLETVFKPVASISKMNNSPFSVPETSSATPFSGPAKNTGIANNIFKGLIPSEESKSNSFNSFSTIPATQAQLDAAQRPAGIDTPLADGVSVFEKLRPAPATFPHNFFGNSNVASQIVSAGSTKGPDTASPLTTTFSSKGSSIFDRISAAPAKFPTNFFGAPSAISQEVPNFSKEDPIIASQKTASTISADDSAQFEQRLSPSPKIASHFSEGSNVLTKSIDVENALASPSVPKMESEGIPSKPNVAEHGGAPTKAKPIISHALAKDVAMQIIREASERYLGEIARKVIKDDKAKAAEEIAEEIFNDGVKSNIRSVAMEATADEFFRRKNLQRVFASWHRKQRKITYRKWGEERRRNPRQYAPPQWRPVVFPDDCTHPFEELEQFTKLVYQSVALKKIFLPKVEDAFWHTEQPNQRWRLLISSTNAQNDLGNYWWIEKFLGHTSNHIAQSKKVTFEAQFQLSDVAEAVDVGGFVFGCSADYQISNDERFNRDKKNLHEAVRYLLENTRFERLALTVVCYRSPLDVKPADILGRDVDRVALNGRCDRIKAIEEALGFDSLPERIIHREIILAENIPDMDFTPAMKRMADSVVETVNPKIAKLLKPKIPRITPRKASAKASSKTPEKVSPPSAGTKRKRNLALANSTSSRPDEATKRSRMQNTGMSTSYFQLKARGLHLDWKSFPMPTGGTIGDIGVPMDLNASHSQQIQGRALYVTETPRRQYAPSSQDSSPMESLRESLKELVKEAGEVNELLDEKWAETEDDRNDYGFLNGV